MNAGIKVFPLFWAASIPADESRSRRDIARWRR